MLPFATYNIPEALEKETPVSLKWLWVIIGEPLSAPDEELLQKICNALGAEFSEDVYIRNIDPMQPVSMSHGPNANPKLIISFGIQPSVIGLWIDVQPSGIRFLEPYAFIYTLPLDELGKSPSAKKQLWRSMQIFLETK